MTHRQSDGLIPDYLNDSAAIYARSAEIIANEVDLTAVPANLHTIAVRLIHSCGMVDIVAELDASANAREAGCQALREGKSVFCDVEMTRRGIIRNLLPDNNALVCGVANDTTYTHARNLGTTRSWAAVDLWNGEHAGAIVVIGNAPTALFRVLELYVEHRIKPALVIGMPVGFVGARESKYALAQSGLDYITILGRRGGSALAAATLNALSTELA